MRECVFIRFGGGGKVERSSPSFSCSVCECINQPERVATDILRLASTSTRTQTHGTVTTNWRPRLFAFHFMSLGFPLYFVLFVPSLLFLTSSRSCSCSFSHFSPHAIHASLTINPLQILIS